LKAAGEHKSKEQDILSKEQKVLACGKIMRKKLLCWK